MAPYTGACRILLSVKFATSLTCFARRGINPFTFTFNFLKVNFFEGENVWVEVTSMNDSRFGCAVVAHQGKIYVSGGFGSDKNILSSSEVYDPGKTKLLRGHS